MVGPTPLGVDFSGLRSKLENPLDDVNCIAIRYKSHHQVPLRSISKMAFDTMLTLSISARGLAFDVTCEDQSSTNACGPKRGKFYILMTEYVCSNLKV